MFVICFLGLLETRILERESDFLSMCGKITRWFVLVIKLEACVKKLGLSSYKVLTILKSLTVCKGSRHTLKVRGKLVYFLVFFTLCNLVLSSPNNQPENLLGASRL